MRFSQEFLDELKARLPVSEVVGRRVKLKKAGREWKGLSPFQQEKSPSFTVNDQKGFYHDFSSGKHGSIFDFVMETEGVPFGEAVERLASMAGMPLPQASPDAERARAAPQDAARHHGAGGDIFCRHARLARRARRRAAISPIAVSIRSTQLKFRMGYAPGERFALKEHLGKAGRPVEDMVEAGLLVIRRRRAGALRSFSRSRDVSDRRCARARHRVRRTRAREGRAGEIPELAEDAAVSQGRQSLQPRRRAACRPQRRDAGRGRRLCRRHRHGRRRFRCRRRAARHRADRKPARAAVADGRRADPLFRRRQGRAEGGVPRRRSRAAASCSPERACALRCCPRDRTPTISRAQAVAARSKR